VRTAIGPLVCLVLLSACSLPRLPDRAAAARQPAAPEPPNPFDDSSASFVVSGARFAPGETAIVKVCVSPDGTIASANIIGSSGDRQFDNFALIWARQVRLRSMPQGTQTEELCGPVRVEIKPASLPPSFADRESSLG
jgi:TonB family protein